MHHEQLRPALTHRGRDAAVARVRRSRHYRGADESAASKITMTNPTSFFQVSATLLGTLLISGVLAETRARSSEPSRWASVLLLAVIASFVVGELLCLDVLVGQPPTRDERLYVEVALAVCALSTCVLAMHAVTPAGKRWFSRVALVAVPVVSVLGFAAAQHVESSVYSGLTHEGLLAQCPGVARGSAFIGSVISAPDTAIRDTPGVNPANRILHRYPTDCVLGFKGFCLGTPVNDSSNKLPDGRWFELQGQGGVVSSANIRNIAVGGPADPAEARPSACHGGAKSYAPLVLRKPRRGVLRATSRSAGSIPYVGFAIEFDDGSGKVSWHRLRPDLDPAGGIEGRIKVANFRRPALALATICLGAEVPAAGATDSSVHGLGRPAPPSTPTALAAGRTTACSLSAG